MMRIWKSPLVSVIGHSRDLFWDRWLKSGEGGEKILSSFFYARGMRHHPIS